MDRVERGKEFGVELKRIRLNERQRVIRLQLNIDAHNLKASARVAHRGPAGAAKEIKQTVFHRRSTVTGFARQ